MHPIWLQAVAKEQVAERRREAEGWRAARAVAAQRRLTRSLRKVVVPNDASALTPAEGRPGITILARRGSHGDQAAQLSGARK